LEEALSTEQKIYKAAKVVFQRKGMAGARMQDIAEEAGINKALLHYYFRSKEKLFQSVFQDIISKIAPALLGILVSELPLQQKVEGVVEKYLDLLEENPYIPIFILNELRSEPDKIAQKIGLIDRVSLEPLGRQLEEEYRKGNIKQIDPMQFLLNLVSLCVFPFIGKPILKEIFGIQDSKFNQLISERRMLIPEFIMNALRL
jgi:AcrR family transcriptional regulator